MKQKEILIASSNEHKINEIKEILRNENTIKIFSLKDFSICIETTEDGSTLEENAFKKAKAAFDVLRIPAISDDTGLFVAALNGEPGIYSARYAGENATYESNCRKLLYNMKNIREGKRNARFESVICLYSGKEIQHYFKGICEGTIVEKERGENGFGYDPLFLPEGFTKTFAEMNDKEKNSVSHRCRALQKLKEFIAGSSG